MERQRTDPIVAVLGVAVSMVAIAAVGFIFYPRIVRWIGPSRDSVVGVPLSPTATVPVWIARAPEGVALLLEGGLDGDTDAVLDGALQGPGPYHYLALTVYNFSGPDPYVLELPAEGLASPEGGPRAIPAVHRLRKDAPEHLRAVLCGLGAIATLRVERGHTGKALLVVGADPTGRTAFVSGDLRFERRELQRQVLASWCQRPDWEEFKDF